MKNKHFSIGEFARQAGVTVRTIQYYDRLGLLMPSGYSTAGRRLYTEADYARLEQILTLKLIGLSLVEIKTVLAASTDNVHHLLEQQKTALRQKAKKLLQVAVIIEKAQAAAGDTQHVSLEAMVHIIRMINMTQEINWFNHFLTPEQQEGMTQRGAGRTLADHKQEGLAWKKLFSDIQAHLNHEASDPALQVLVNRWDALILQSAGGDRELAQALTAAYAGIEHDLAEVNEWTQGISQCAAFVAKTRKGMSLA